MIYVIGTRTTSSEVADQIDLQQFGGYVECKWKTKKTFADYPVSWYENINFQKDYFVIGIASSFHRRNYFEMLEKIYKPKWITVVSPDASISRSVLLDSACVISRLASIGSQTTMGKCVFLNRGASVGHDCSIGNFVTFSPGCRTGGLCTIGNGAYIAMGATIVDRIVIGENSFVAAGAVVIQDVPPNTLVAGIPAKSIEVRNKSRILDRIDSSKYRIT